MVLSRAVLTALYAHGKQCTWALLPTQPLTGIQMWMDDTIEHMLIVLVLPTTSVFKHYTKCSTQHT